MTQSYNRVSIISFFLLTIVLYLVIAYAFEVPIRRDLLSLGVITQLLVDGKFDLVTTILEIFSVVPILLLQAGLLKFQFNWSALRWILASLIGLIMSLVGDDLIASTALSAFPIVGALLAGFSIPIAQTIVLHAVARHAWLWLCISFLSAVINFALNFYGVSLLSLGTGTTLVLTSALIQGTLFALIMSLFGTVLSKDKLDE